MNQRSHARAHADVTSHTVDHDGPAPGRSAASALLQAPDHPITSGLLQRKARDGNGVAAEADAAVSAASSSSGSSLPDALMRKFESSLGTDLSSVRVHTGAESAAAADAVGARAYTVGQDIHFAAGQYDPSSQAGEHLIAHEVAHTVQQRGGAPTRQHKLAVSAPHDAAEHEADRAADAMVSGGAFTVGGGSPMIARAPAENASGNANVGKFTYALPSESIPERPWGQWVYVGAEGTPVVEVEATPEGNSTNPETKNTGHVKVQPGKSVKYEAEAKRVYSENALVKVNQSDKIGIDLKKQKIELGQGVSIETKSGPMPVELGANFLPFVWEKGKLKLLTGEISGKVTLLEKKVPLDSCTLKIKPRVELKLTVRPNLEHLAKVLFEKLAPRLAAHAASFAITGGLVAGAAMMIFHYFDTIEAVGDMHRIDASVIAGKADIVKRIDALTAAIHNGSDTSGLLAQLTTDVGGEIGGLTPQDVGAMLKDAMPIDKLRQTLWTPARARLMADAIAKFRKDHKFASMVHDGKRKMDQLTGENERKLNPTDMIDALQLRLNASLPEQIGSGPATSGPAIC